MRVSRLSLRCSSRAMSVLRCSFCGKCFKSTITKIKTHHVRVQRNLPSFRSFPFFFTLSGHVLCLTDTCFTLQLHWDNLYLYFYNSTESRSACQAVHRHTSSSSENLEARVIESTSLNMTCLCEWSSTVNQTTVSLQHKLSWLELHYAFFPIKTLVAGPARMGADRAQPEEATWDRLPVGLPPAGGAKGVGCL